MESERGTSAVVDADRHWSDSVLDVALEAFISIDVDGRVQAWNPAAARTFGWSRADACGGLLDEMIVPERFRAAHRAGLARLAAGEPGRVLGQRLTLRALHRDGREFPIEMTLTATGSGVDMRFHAFAHDITVADRAHRFTAVEAAVSYELARAGSSTEAAAHVVQALGTRMDWAVVELWLVDEARQVLVCAARHSAGGADLGAFAMQELAYGWGIPGVVCREGHPVWVADLATDTRWPRSAEAARRGLHVAVGVPIRPGPRVLGALTVFGDTVQDPEDTLVSLLRGVAAHVGQFLERRRAEELAVELAATKDEFVALVTHELRNPLAVISGAVELLTTDADALSAEQHRHYVEVIGRSAERLTTMAGDLLDLARLESESMAVRPAAMDLADVLRQAAEQVVVQAAGKGLTVTVVVPPRLALEGDADRLRQVADNLLSNAVKYTPDGGSVAVRAYLSPDATEVVWRVSDTGIGIPVAERPRLFRRFYRASTALERRIPGTGLGLVIVRAIVERHHGTITVAEQEGPGTTFEVRLPVTARPH